MLDGVLVFPEVGDQILRRRSRALQSVPAAGFPLPLRRRAPVLRLGPNWLRAFLKRSLTKALLPIAAPSEKYLMRQRSMVAMVRSGRVEGFGEAEVGFCILFLGLGGGEFGDLDWAFFLSRAMAMICR